jgi:RNA polymerase sigma-54 factor
MVKKLHRDTIRVKLQELIDGEDKRSPLSDDDLVDALGTQGIRLARRTITKDIASKCTSPAHASRREY